MTVLIITHTQDNESIARVMQAIEKRGGKAFRFNTDRFPTEVNLDIYYNNQCDTSLTLSSAHRIKLVDNQQELDFSQVSSVWYRRIAIAANIPTTMDAQLRHASIQESRTTILGMISCIQGFHLDSLINIRHAENKQLQLQVARSLGIEIPRTLTTNNPQAVREFTQACPQGIVTKMLSSFAIYDAQGQEKVVFTNTVKPEDLENLDGLRFCPMTFQEKIPKALELRTTIVGKQVFTAAVDSQVLPMAQDDWRKKGITLLNAWQAYDLPADVEEKLLKFMAYFGLNYGAIDIILTPDNRHVFLEINPVGEFFWLERNPGLKISDAIAQILLSN